MDRRRQIPMVRPPRQAGGGGSNAPSFGMSGAPGYPNITGSKRAYDEMRLRYAMARGRFSERLFVFPQFAALNATTNPFDTQQIDIKSNGDSFVRLVAMRGAFTENAAPTGIVAGQSNAGLFALLNIDGLEDFMTSGRQSNPASFDIMFSNESAPWLWLAAPPLLRVGETLSVRISTILTGIEYAITPQFAVRLVDDDVWCQLYQGGNPYAAMADAVDGEDDDGDEG